MRAATLALTFWFAIGSQNLLTAQDHAAPTRPQAPIGGSVGESRATSGTPESARIIGLLISKGEFRLLPSGTHDFADMPLERDTVLIACRKCELTNETPQNLTQATCTGPLFVRCNDMRAEGSEARFCNNVLTLSQSSDAKPVSVLRHVTEGRPTMFLTAAKVTLDFSAGTIKVEDAMSMTGPAGSSATASPPPK